MPCYRLALRCAGALLLANGGILGYAQTSGGVWLEVQSQNLRVEANGSAILKPSAVPLLDVHLGRQPQDVPYKNVTIRLNAEVANIVSTMRATEEGIICTLDMSGKRGFALKPGRNSVEVTYKDHWSAVYYTSFMLQVPVEKAEAGSHRAGSPASEPVFAGGRRFAVVVGVGKYKFGGAGVENLSYADSDASAMQRSLVHGGGIPSENVRLLLNEDATLDNLKLALTQFLAGVKPDDTVILYFNMQGAYDPDDPDRKYLLAYDSDPRDMANTAMPVADLSNLLSNSIHSKHIVVLADTCHGNGTGVDVAVKTKPDNLVNLYLVRALQLQGIAAIEASDVHQLSQEGSQWKGAGAFTYYVLCGLSGKADSNGDGTVTANELFTYVQLQVTRDTLDQQLPIAALSRSGDPALTGVMTGKKSGSPLAGAK